MKTLIKKLRVVLRLTALTLAAIGVSAFAYEGWQYHQRITIERLESLPIDSVVKELRIPLFTKHELQALATKVAREEGIDPIILTTIINQESGWNPHTFRHEPHLEAKFGRAGSTSFGLTQVIYGWHKDRCGLSSHLELFDAEVNIRCGIAVFRHCLKSSSVKDKSGKLRDALRCYNGSGNQAREYSNQLMASIQQQLIDQLMF